MKIKGFHKTSLIDYPGKICCTIFLFGCNFRCGFCHNPELVLGRPVASYSEEEILKFLGKRKEYLDGVCITGGEPLLSLDMDFVKKIKAMGYSVKIDTNGCFPEKLGEFVDAGLVDFVSMDIKASKENYSNIAGMDCDFEKIEKSMKIISGLEDYEFRTTITKIHDVEEVKKMMEWSKEVVGEIKRFALQGFHKRDKMIDETFKMEKDISESYLNELKKVVENYVEKVVVRV